nr:hypothetical protein [Tanacetum cinerariifolium]
MKCIEEIAKDAKVIEIDNQLLVLIKRQVETELMLEEKFRDLCEEMMAAESHLSVREKHIFGFFKGMLVFCDRENVRDLEFGNGLDNLWVELLERTNERENTRGKKRVKVTPLVPKVSIRHVDPKEFMLHRWSLRGRSMHISNLQLD